MSVEFAITISVFSFMVLLLMVGEWIGLAFGTVAIILAVIVSGPNAFDILASRSFAALNSPLLTTIPMFTLMGTLASEAGIARGLYIAVEPFVARLPGKLLHTNIIAGAIFGAACGSAIAGAATLGSIACKDQEARGYDRKMVIGSVAASGTLSILIPPSVIMIIYGAMTSESVPKLFLAGVIPGIILSIMFMIYIFVVAKMRPGIAPPSPKSALSLGSQLKGLSGIGPFIILAVLVLGSIWLGLMTATEASAAGALGAILVCLVAGRLTLKVFKHALVSTMHVTCMCMLIYMGGQMLSIALSYAGVLRYVSETLTSLPIGPYGILGIILILYLILGCLIDSLSMIVLTINITYPIVTQLGFDGIWFGIIIVLLVQIGLMTPPVAAVIYVLQTVTDCSLGEASYAALPYVFISIVCALLLTAFPQIALWLPSLLG